MHVIRLAAQAAIDSAGLAMQDLTATLPGQTELTGAVTIDPAAAVRIRP